YISLRTGNCNASYDDFSVFRSRTTDESITVGTGNDDMARYQNASPTSPACKISTILIDNTNNFSPVLDKTVNIDWTEPVAIGIPAEGTVSDIDTSYSTTNFDGFWNAATDTHSGVAFYEYSIGTTSGATNIVNWTAVATSTSIALSALSLEYDSTYFLSMRCTNAAGLTSTITSSDGVLIQNPVSPDAIFSTAQTTLCAGDSILYNNSSTGATDFEWIFEGGAPASSTLNNPGYITYPTAGQYDVTLIAVNGSQSDTTTLADYIHIYEQPVAAFSATDDTLYLPNAFVAFTNQSQGATSYIWTFGDASSSTETDPWHIYDTTGVYTVVLIANNGACSDSIVSTDAIVVLVISSASAETGEENVRIFPQPVKEYINITLPSGFSGEVRVTITDMTGNIVLAKQCEVVQGSPNIINLHGIAPGNYLLSVSSGESTYSSLLILISE
ncbi:MAG: PKD domain-containing protein, partial [Bacteroidetes bacterium]|nr:PKD domain-containing protein [Bacteroidota bacterium]